MSDEKPTPRERYIEPPAISEPLRLIPSADMAEALARAQNPRRLWPVLHAVDAQIRETHSLPFGWALATILLLCATALGRC